MDFFSHFGITEEDQKKIKEQYEKAEMVREEFRHAFQRLFEELNEDQLRTLHTMLRIILEHDHPGIIGEWYGICGWALKTRFNICVTCGVNHDTEFEENVPHTTVTRNYETADLHVVGEDQPLPAFYELTEEDIRNMEEYHLDDLREEGTNELLGFICTGIKGWDKPCGVRYPSIEDRMLRDPESCSGCHQRMMHG